MFAISYDQRETLADFAARNGIGFPLLSDEGSRVIREVGVFDENLEQHQQAFGVTMRPDQWGVAYPTTFVLDAEGRVVEKWTEETYRLRESGSRVVRRLAGDAPAAHGEAVASAQAATNVGSEVSEGPVTAQVALDGTTYFPYQRRDLRIDLRMEDGWHVYGRRSPEGCTAIEVSLASTPEGVRSESVLWPAATPFAVAGDVVPTDVYAVEAHIVVPITFVIQRGSGDVVLDVAIDFQACDVTRCLPPSRLRAELRIPEAPVP